MKWNNTYSTGIERFDEQHKGIIILLNRLLDTMKDQRKTDETGTVLSELTAFSDNHFTEEEDAMMRHGYPHYSKHYVEHNTLRSKVSELRQKHAEGDMPHTVEMLKFISHWVDSHLKDTDINYGPFLIKKGFK